METDTPMSYSYMGRNFTEDSTSSAFSDCNSDRSGEFSTTSSQNRRLLLACASENSDDLIRQLVIDLESSSIDAQRQAAMEIRLLAKNKEENRLKIARAGAVKPLVSLIQSGDPQLQEYGVTAILNLSLWDENKDLIAGSGAIKPLIKALRTRTRNWEIRTAASCCRAKRWRKRRKSKQSRMGGWERETDRGRLGETMRNREGGGAGKERDVPSPSLPLRPSSVAIAAATRRR